MTGATGLAELATSNGPIRFSGTLADGDHTFATTNGGIVLTLPAGARFRVDATTSHGSVVSDFSGQKAAPTGRVHLQEIVGDKPAVTIKLRTSNGSIAIRKQNVTGRG